MIRKCFLANLLNCSILGRKMYFSFLLLRIIFSFAGGATSAHTAGVELHYTKSYTYLRIESNFVYIKLKSEESATIVLAETPFSPHSNEERRDSDRYYSPTTTTTFGPYFPSSSDFMETGTGSAPFYKFSLHNSQRSGLRSRFEVNDQLKAEVDTSQLLSSHQFVEFLIYWFNDFLIFSRIGDPFPIFYRKDIQSNLDTIKYIGIRTGDQNSDYPTRENHWKIDFSSSRNLSEAFALYLNSSFNPLLMTESSKDTPEITTEEHFVGSILPSPSSQWSSIPAEISPLYPISRSPFHRRGL